MCTSAESKFLEYWRSLLHRKALQFFYKKHTDIFRSIATRPVSSVDAGRMYHVRDQGWNSGKLERGLCGSVTKITWKLSVTLKKHDYISDGEAQEHSMDRGRRSYELTNVVV